MIRAASTSDDPMPQLKAALARGLRRAAHHLWAQLQEVLNTPNTGVRVRGKRGRPGHTAYPNPSRPGEPPRKRTGWLQRNVVYEIDPDALTARIGVRANAPYGLYLELGTGSMAARPWLLVTARAAAPAMAEILAQEVPGG